MEDMEGEFEWDGNGGIKEERISEWAGKGVKSVKENVKGVGGRHSHNYSIVIFLIRLMIATLENIVRNEYCTWRDWDNQDDGKVDSGSGGGRRKKAMAGYLPQRKTDGSSNTSSSNSHGSANHNSSSSSTSGGLSQDATPGLGEGGRVASGTCGKSGRGPRPKSDSSNSIVGVKNSKTGASSDGMVTSAVGSYRSDGYNNFKDQRSQGNLYAGTSSCGGGIAGPALRKAPLAPTLHPHPQSQNQQLHQHPHLPLSALLDDSEDDVTSSVNNAISAITAAAANCMTGELNNSGRGDDRRDIIGGLLGGLGLGPLGSPGGPSSTSGMEKSFRGGENQDALALHQQSIQQTPGGKPKRPRKPRKKKEPGAAGAEPSKRRQSSQRSAGGLGDVRPYLCSICGRGFARRETLRRHDRIHTGEKPHHCTVCGKYFREAFHLSKHHTVHSGEKNYKCLLCGKDFGYAQSLKRHGKLHQKGEMEEVPTTPGGENLSSYPAPGASMIPGGQGNSSFYPYPQDVKPQGSNPHPPPRLYTCAICWKSFRHHFHLTAHHQTVHEGGGDKLFSCEMCGKAFAYSNSLTRHRLSQHGLTRTGQGTPQGSTSVAGEDSSVGGSVSESEAATNALLQLAPSGATQGEEDSHSGVLHSHQHAPPQPQAGYSPLFYDASTSLPSSSNATPYSQPLPSSSSLQSHQHSGVKVSWMMAGPPSQRLLPPSGPKTHFRSLDHAGGDSLNTGPVNTGPDLKSPPQTPLKGDQRFKDCCEMKEKDRLDMDEDSLGRCSIRDRSSNGQGADGSGLGTGAGAGTGTFQSLWERTVASDPGLFQLHYMDLGEFLTENGMAMHGAQIPSQSSQCPSTSPSPCSSSSSSSASAASPPTLLGLDMQVQQSMLGAAGCLHSPPQGSIEPTPSPSCPPLTAPPMTNANDILTTFDPDPADVALPSIPGQEAFDPRTHCFSEDDLKPQPVIKKARKMLVPDSLKDEKYWSRRLKNNEAAKRSRDARRVKENQISVRAAFLERENAALRQEVANMRKELGRCRNILNKYENRYLEQL
ncbi:hypothetical protein QTP86_004900 [Hemibagrus guttatus]|nr:hypothetical protein QTP86_004900 [Hemibagrus guttatus]